MHFSVSFLVVRLHIFLRRIGYEALFVSVFDRVGPSLFLVCLFEAPAHHFFLVCVHISHDLRSFSDFTAHFLPNESVNKWAQSGFITFSIYFWVFETHTRLCYIEKRDRTDKFESKYMLSMGEWRGISTNARRTSVV